MAKFSNGLHTTMRRIWFLAAALLLAIVLVYAYVDGGIEEPELIEQEIEVGSRT